MWHYITTVPTNPGAQATQHRGRWWLPVKGHIALGAPGTGGGGGGGGGGITSQLWQGGVSAFQEAERKQNTAVDFSVQIF